MIGMSSHQLFSLEGRTALITGGTGALGFAIAEGLGNAGARIAIMSRSEEKAARVAGELGGLGLTALGVAGDCGTENQVARALDRVVGELGPVDVLVNAAGGNQPAATVSLDKSIGSVSADAIREVVDLNLMAGAVIPSIVVGEHMVEHARPSSIINISSMAAQRPLTRVLGYSAAKASVENFTRWLSVHFAMDVGADIRVNAIAPGFFLTEQNRFLLKQEDGSLSPRGQSIIQATPMNRFGNPEEVVGACVWLAGKAASFVTGTVVNVDGGFSAYSGV